MRLINYCESSDKYAPVGFIMDITIDTIGLPAEH